MRHRTCILLIFTRLKLLIIKETALAQLIGDYGRYSPSFEKKMIEENREDGYWIEAFQAENRGAIELVAYGLNKGEINLYQNPNKTTEPGEPTLIENLDSPVAMDQADITGNGYNDIIICFRYGKTMLDCDPDGGKIVWLENPGQNVDKKLWTKHYVGRSTAMHRLKVGHFTQIERWEILGLPIVSQPFDLLSPVPVLLFRQPDSIFNATEWPFEIINQHFFHLIHDATILKGDQLDNVLIASREGISWLYFNQTLKQWMIESIGKGEQAEKQQTVYYGSGCIDVGQVGSNPLSYIATAEPFHGNTVAVYVKNTNNTLKQSEWKRYVLDVYGQPNEQGEGPIHHVVSADFDKDGDDEFLVALRGPFPNQGVYLYKPIDHSRGLFSKWKVSNDSAARIAVADYDNDGFLDFATISYAVPGYYVSENPSINIFYNRFVEEKPQITNEIQVMKQNNELIFKVSRPSKVLQYQALPFMTIHGITFSLEVLPPHSSRQVDSRIYIKVLWGNIMWTDSSIKSNQFVNHSRTFLCQPRTVCSLEIHSDSDRITAGSEGALLFIHKLRVDMNNIAPVDDIKKVTLENSLPEYCPEETRQVAFQFIRYDQYDSAEQFKDVEFYNLKGFDIKFADNNERLCYVQLWAAGLGVNAGVHNHAKASFCEIHVCIINGSGKGGMHYLNNSKEVYDPLTTPDSAFEKLPLPIFYEHGALWDIDSQNKPVLRSDGTVVYPWHKWQAGTNGSLNQSFDIWTVFEFNAQLLASPSCSHSLLNSYIVLFCSYFVSFLFIN
ncbi:unnamed protein product [Adineta steineri]|uniref:Uncharacterized protein n=1 Tax=Adineta steineri TaxID=433720 RepID=A0A814UH54_9BILA|nr:unnamed protein product [Adineta steineri]CAF1174532.1 unnamed protein product [Adineta steineri]